MKIRNFLLLVIAVLTTIASFSQTPQAFKYQAIARNASGEIIVNKPVSILIGIIKDASTIYSESHQIITNQFGLINLEIGKGTAETGVFSDIDWSLGSYYVAVSIDPDGGTDYLPVGTAQLLSVPYALYADKSGDSHWKKDIQSNLDYNKGKVMIGSPDFLTGDGDPNRLPALSIAGGIWTKMPVGITTADIDNMDLNNSSIGTGLPLVGLYSIYDGDYHLRGFWGVNIDRNGGNWGYDYPDYTGLNPDAGSFAVRYRTSPTKFRTDFIINGLGNVGIGTTDLTGYFSPKLWVKGSYLQVSDTGLHDAGIVINHLNKTGYGFARTILIVNEGVIGDPYNEFRIRNTDDNLTTTSWSLGVDNNDDDKFIISNLVNTPTGASPSVGDKFLCITTKGNIGIGTTSPQRKLHINDVMRLEPIMAAPIDPAEGDMYMDATTHKLKVFDGSIWQACW
jgi:hypothetical protein